MPVTPSYPGVYIEEVPSSVRTIVGVATSITAFIGRALRGPVNEPVRVQSFGEFERIFGGLWFHSTMSYAVRQFFQNGGSDALIIRIVGDDSVAATVELEPVSGIDKFSLAAASSGEWGNRIRVQVSGGSLEVQEVDEAGSLDPIVLNADNSLIVVTSDPLVTPKDVGWTYLTGGVSAATEARALVPVTAEWLVLQAASAGEDGNNLRATVIHSTSNADNFALILKDLSGSTVERYGELTVANVDDVTKVGGSALVAVTAKPAVRPAEVTELAFTGGSATEKATASLPAIMESLDLEAASEGDWGNSLQAIVDYDTGTASTELFNLTIEELDQDGNAVSREILRNLTLDEEATQFIAKVLEVESDLAGTIEPLPASRPLESAARFFGGGDGGELEDGDYQGSEVGKTGIYALADADLFNLLCIAPRTRTADVGTAVLADALAYCRARRAMLIVDPPSSWNDTADAEDTTTGVSGLRATLGAAASANAIAYFPRLVMGDPLKQNRPEEFVPCGAVAGIIARTDAQRGVWKAPAGTEATFSGVREMSYWLTDGENGRLNPLGLNALRTFPAYGHVVWGARTLAGDDRIASEWKYIPVRRLALFLEESLYRGTHWVVFEPNDEPLWAQIRLNVGAFMHGLFRQGAFQGTSPRDAYFVKCDSETTTQNDINLGIVNILVGFAPLKPAEFVIIKISQIAGQIET